MGQPGDQHVRQVRQRHLPLGEGDVVLDPVGGQGAPVGVQDRVGGAGVAIAGLADAAGVDDVARLPEVEGVAGTQLPDLGQGVARVHGGVHGDVGVADQADVGVEVAKIVGGARHAGDV